MNGLVFNIERCAIEDGPGIRTAVFLKGCALKCKWCANPESQLFTREVLVKTAICSQCGKCQEICPKGHIEHLEGFGFITTNNDCGDCQLCCDECVMAARVIQGKKWEPEKLVKELLKDKPYFDRSGGGVTFTGGEPLFPIDFVEKCCELLKKEGVHVLFETCGQVPRSHVERAAKFADAFYYDVKHMDTVKHEALTGMGNEEILDNLRWLCENFKGDISVRYPYIPGCNDEKEAIEAFLQFASSLNVKEVVFLPYHRLGLPKYQGLGREYPMGGDMVSLKTGDIAFLKEYEKQYPVKIVI